MKLRYSVNLSNRCQHKWSSRKQHHSNRPFIPQVIHFQFKFMWRHIEIIYYHKILPTPMLSQNEQNIAPNFFLGLNKSIFFLILNLPNHKNIPSCSRHDTIEICSQCQNQTQTPYENMHTYVECGKSRSAYFRT